MQIVAPTQYAQDTTCSEPRVDKYAIIGAGPSGLATARCLDLYGIPYEVFEAGADVGGLWNIKNPDSVVYESTHLISSKRMTEFKDFPMGEHVPDFPHHSEILQYFRDYTSTFGIYPQIRFNTRIQRIEPVGSDWRITFSEDEVALYKGVIIATGTLSKPKLPTFPGNFSGEILHAAHYKSPAVFEGKRVLVVGAGNSGCDIAVDAVHRAQAVSMSVRRGYYFVPKYIWGKPADTIGGMLTLPRSIKQVVDKRLLKIFTGDPTKFGLPEPDYKLYESHPVVNSLILHHMGHGDIDVKGDICHMEGKTIHFKKGAAEDYDLILCATGYQLRYPFIDSKYLDWEGASPDLMLNIFPKHHHNLFVMGMVEAAGLGWQGRYEQAELIAKYLQHYEQKTEVAQNFIAEKQSHKPDLHGGFKYLKLDRMSYYVHKDTYKKELKKYRKRFPRLDMKAHFAREQKPATQAANLIPVKAHRVLVTGANGYLGRQLMQSLAQKIGKDEAACLMAMDIKSLPEAEQLGQVNYLVEDIRSKAIAAILKKYQIDTVIHLAAIVQPSKNSSRELEYSVDVLGTENILDACVEAGVQRIVTTSSGAAYGYYKDNPSWISEDNPIRGNKEFAYAYHKKLVEEMMQRYRDEHPQLEQIIFRVGTILGKDTRNQITAMFDRAMPPRVMGARSPFVFIWDQDVVQCLVTALDSEQTGVFNLAGDGAVSMKEIAKMMGKRCLALPHWVFKIMFLVMKTLRKNRYGPEIVKFIQYRPVLSNEKLKDVYHYFPRLSSRQVFAYYWAMRKTAGN